MYNKNKVSKNKKMGSRYNSAQRQYFGYLMIKNLKNLNNDNLLINGDREDIRALYAIYSPDQLLGGFYEFIERNYNRIGIDLVLEKVIDIDGRLLNIDLALLVCQYLPAFIIFINKGYSIDKDFIDRFSSQVYDLKEDMELINKSYNPTIKYLKQHNYIIADSFLDRIYQGYNSFN